jgi:hypothetical protein
MQVLSNRFTVGIPASDLVRQAEREGVNRRWGADPRAGIKAGDATRAPLDVRDAGQDGHDMSVAVKDNRRRVDCCGCRLWVFHVHQADLLKVV